MHSDSMVGCVTKEFIHQRWSTSTQKGYGKWFDVSKMVTVIREGKALSFHWDRDRAVVSVGECAGGGR